MQDMFTRLLSANLDFDSEFQHVLCWEPDECRVSRVFHVDRVFLRLLLNAVSRVWLGCIKRYTWARTLLSLVLLLSDRQRWTSAEHVTLIISVCLFSPFYFALSQSVFLERYREDYHVPAQVLILINR